MDQVKFVEGRLQKIEKGIVCLYVSFKKYH